MKTMKIWCYFPIFLLASSILWKPAICNISAIGDPGMRRDGLRVAIEAWNQCNEVGEEPPNMGSPRLADCFDVDSSKSPVNLVHKVNEKDNKLGILNGGDVGLDTSNVDKFAAEKELYLADKCRVDDADGPWNFWMLMLKSGNTDTYASRCPKNGYKSKPFPTESRFPCFGDGCMNMPLIYHHYTKLGGSNNKTMTGSFYGTWDLGTDFSNGQIPDNGTSYFKITWKKELGTGSWVFHHLLRTSKKYPWLMLYLRSDATSGFSGGYHYETRGMSKAILKSPNFKVKFRLDVKQGGGPGSQFYLMDMGSCWKNDGRPCDGDVTSDVTRYSEMIINPSTPDWCTPQTVEHCPPYHTFRNGTRVHRSNNASYPFGAYHMYCAPGNARFLEEPFTRCDPYSNPQPQEILQIIPHPVWGEYGYPTKKGEGWIGDPRTWELDVGALSKSLHFYQDPLTEPVERHWSSIDLGTEVYMSADQVAEWTVSDFDIIITK
ncbi:hypothetical protein K2173_025997 [Erythroxylum novogranatense]|uniref:DUF7705 domain-containing protein n=1 Tax=Erythroxylum novogranatense TaxID=1862640 RepID=A0AAV8TWE3_9ROSI|nr:hypothetical protein K2173_025997 [Erythroxylum novogranatense]